jgi:glycosyltransferase involved in cell wall biosynthesis
MPDVADHKTRFDAGPTCAFVAFEPMKDSAHTVYILETYDALASLGVDTELLVYPPDGPKTPSPAELRQRYGLTNTPRISWIPRDANRWAERVRLIATSIRASRRRTYAYTTRPLAALGALIGGARGVVLEFHIEIKPRHDRLAFGMIRRSKRLRVVCVSRRLAERIAEQTGMDESAIIVEHNGATFPIRHDYTADSADGRRLRATYAGTFAPGRGLETILELARLNPTVDFVIVGGEAPPGRLADNVIPMGRVPHAEVPKLLAEADILLMPYTKCAMLPDGGGGTAEYCSPLKMMEYLSAGRSIIASNLPSIAEILVDGSNCLLVDAESPGEWSEAIERLQRDDELRALLARGATQTAEQHTIQGRVGRILEQTGIET